MNDYIISTIEMEKSSGMSDRELMKKKMMKKMKKRMMDKEKEKKKTDAEKVSIAYCEWYPKSLSIFNHV